MQIGATFPQAEIGADPAEVRAYAQAVEDLGYDYLLAYDHVLGADVERRPDWTVMGGRPPYTHKSLFHEPFVMFGYLASCTERIGLATGVLVLGQRQTALVAKQAAEVDVLSGGRLRLGVGTGWNHVEYEGLGMDFGNRGRRSEEQIELLRKLWSEPIVDFEGRWHEMPGAGINPLPLQRPIPIWLGGGVEAVARRVGRVGDGFFPMVPPERLGPMLDAMREEAQAAGRDPAAIGLEGSVMQGGREPASCVEDLETWRKLGATHMTFTPMNSGHDNIDAQIRAVREFRAAL